MSEISWSIVVIGAMGNFVIGLVTYLKNTKSATNRWFGIFSFLIALYLIFNQFSISQVDEYTTLIWIRAVMVVAPAIVFSFFVLVSVFPFDKFRVSNSVFYASMSFTIIVMTLAATPLFFESVKLSPQVQPQSGPLIFLFIIYNALYIGWSVFILLRKYFGSEKQEKLQLKYLITGAVIMFSLILLSNVILVIFYNISTFVFLVPLYTLTFVGLTGFAIVRFGLFDVKIIATEATTVVLCTILFSKFFTTQSRSETLIDVAVFLLVVIFGILLVKNVRKEIEQKKQLEILNKRLKEVDKKKDEFLNIASHELRAPMTAIKGYIAMIQEEFGKKKVPGNAKEYLLEAADETDRMIRLVNNMLNVARIEEDRMVYETKKIKLSEIVKRVYNEFKFEADDKKMKYELEMEKDLSDTIYVDEDRIHEVVANLVNNAVKYTDDGGKILVRLSNPGSEKVRFEVEDNGPGMTEEELQKLFSKFYRAESYVGKKVGSGLGLYISKLIVKRFDGEIGVESKKGKGSTFWFELPLKT